MRVHNILFIHDIVDVVYTCTEKCHCLSVRSFSNEHESCINVTSYKMVYY